MTPEITHSLFLWKYRSAPNTKLDNNKYDPSPRYSILFQLFAQHLKWNEKIKKI